MTQINCPTCRKPFDPTESRAMPFCSQRCRQIDLGRWLKEDIAIPVRELPDDDRSTHHGETEED